MTERLVRCWHGTPPARAERIRRLGLAAGSFVTTDVELAWSMGLRRGVLDSGRCPEQVVIFELAIAEDALEPVVGLHAALGREWILPRGCPPEAIVRCGPGRPLSELDRRRIEMEMVAIGIDGATGRLL